MASCPSPPLLPPCNAFACTVSGGASANASASGTCACPTGLYGYVGDFAPAAGGEFNSCAVKRDAVVALYALAVLGNGGSVLFQAWALVKKARSGGVRVRESCWCFRRRARSPANQPQHKLQTWQVIVATLLTTTFFAITGAIRLSTALNADVSSAAAGGIGVDAASTATLAVGFATFAVATALFFSLVLGVLNRYAAVFGRASASSDSQGDWRHRAIWSVQPLATALAMAGSFTPLYSVAAPTVESVATSGRVFFVSWAIYAVAYGFVIGPWFLLPLARNLAEAGQVESSSSTGMPKSAASKSMASLRFKILVLVTAIVALGGGQSVILFAFAFDEALQRAGSSYLVPVMITLDGVIFTFAAWTMVNVASSGNKAAAAATTSAGATVKGQAARPATPLVVAVASPAQVAVDTPPVSSSHPSQHESSSAWNLRMSVASIDRVGALGSLPRSLSPHALRQAMIIVNSLDWLESRDRRPAWASATTNRTDGRIPGNPPPGKPPHRFLVSAPASRAKTPLPTRQLGLALVSRSHTPLRRVPPEPACAPALPQATSNKLRRAGRKDGAGGEPGSDAEAGRAARARAKGRRQRSTTVRANTATVATVAVAVAVAVVVTRLAAGRGVGGPVALCGGRGRDATSARESGVGWGAHRQGRTHRPTT